MKSRNLLLLTLALSFSSVYAQDAQQVLNTDPIDVDGYLHEKKVTDGELEQIKGALETTRYFREVWCAPRAKSRHAEQNGHSTDANAAVEAKEEIEGVAS